jgi:hypothetical protein
LGTASAISNPISGCIVVFQYADTQATVSFGGGGDLAPASVTIPITRQKWPTVTTLTVTPQDRAGAPVTLTASVDEFYEFMCRSRVPAPSGAIRFFDGTLFLGQTVLTPPSGSCQNPSVATLTVARPVGTSAFRAEFTETEAHLGSVSTTVSVTIR